MWPQETNLLFYILFVNIKECLTLSTTACGVVDHPKVGVVQGCHEKSSQGLHKVSILLRIDKSAQENPHARATCHFQCTFTSFTNVISVEINIELYSNWDILKIPVSCSWEQAGHLNEAGLPLVRLTLHRPDFS